MSAPIARQILELIGPSCHDRARRDRLITAQQLNGIDFIEFEEIPGTPSRHLLHVHFLLDLPAGGNNDAYGLPNRLSAIQVLGGTRISGITVMSAVRTGARILDVEVDKQGDYSPYLLTIGWSRGASASYRDDTGAWRWDETGWAYSFNEIDRAFSVAAINFRPGCDIDFDCAPGQACPPDALPEPALDYLARDYASFRQLLLDLVSARHPSWTERSPADIGIALVELFAYEGDYISYFQDAVANEAYLDTARQRASAKRHAKLVDYEMHDGRNASTFAFFEVGTPGTIPARSQLVTRIVAPLGHDLDPPGTLLKPIDDLAYRSDPALSQVRVFETSADAVCNPLNNEIYIHTWGNEQCCLPRRTRTAHLYAIDRQAAAPVAKRPPLKAGDYLLLEEVRGLITGADADKDSTHRQVVQILRVSPDPYSTTTGAAADAMRDQLFLAEIDPQTDLPKPAPAPPGLNPPPPLPLLEVTWRAVDALKFPLCVSARVVDAQDENGETNEVERRIWDDRRNLRRLSVARGNLVVADHGRTVSEPFDFDKPVTDARIRLRLSQGPLTMTAPPGADPRSARPAVQLLASAGAQSSLWSPLSDLLTTSEFSQRFVADVDDDGRAVLRFGDGDYGQRFVGMTSVTATYRVGNGLAGNIGADALAHIVGPMVLGWPVVKGLRNPVPGEGGVDPESIEHVRQHAPAAFRASQHRAVTEDDYRKAALTIDGVVGAVAAFRWTGSWYTVFVAIDPRDPDSVITNERGVTRLEPLFKQHVLDALTSYRLAGYDLEIRAARYIPLDITVRLCAKPGYFAGDVGRAVSLAIGGVNRLGSGPGLFDAINFTFGQPVYLSALYAAIEAVDGVESATVTEFHPYGREPGNELANGLIPIGTWEIARLDNDRSNMENGTLTIVSGGGS